MMKRKALGKRICAASLAVAGVIGGATFRPAQASAAVVPAQSPVLPGLPAPATLPAATAPANVYQYSIMPRYVAAGEPAIAEVNGQRLSEKKFTNSLILLNGMPLFAKWLQLTLLKQACRQAGLHVGPAQIKAQEKDVMASLAKQHIPRTERMAVLERLLARRGENILEFQMDLSRTAYILALAKGHVRVTRKQIKLAYQTNYGPKLLVRDIVVRNLDGAAMVRHLIMDKHEDPARVAKADSVDKQTAANGGLEFIPVHDTALPPLFLQTALDLKKGHLSPAIPLNGAYHLLWLVKKIPARKTPLAKVRAQIKKKILHILKLQWGQREINRLLAAAKIKIYNPILARQYQPFREALREQQKLLQAEKNLTNGKPATTKPQPGK